MTIDISILLNWIISGFLGLCFGIVSTWFTYRYERKRDDISWEREKLTRNDEWEREKEKLRLQWAKDEEKLRQQWEKEQQAMRQQLEHERDLVLLQAHQRLKEIEQQFLQQDRIRIREEILKGLDNPAQAILDLERTKKQIELMRNNLENLEERKTNWLENYSFNFESLEKKYRDQYENWNSHFADARRELEHAHHRVWADYQEFKNSLTPLDWSQRAIAIGIWLVIPILLLILIRLLVLS